MPPQIGNQGLRSLFEFKKKKVKEYEKEKEKERKFDEKYFK